MIASLDALIKELDYFATGLTKTCENLSRISCELPKSAPSRTSVPGSKKGNKNAMMTVESPIFSGMWNRLATFHFGCPPGISSLARSIRSNIIETAKTIKAKYLQNYEKVTTMVANLEIMYEVKTDDINRASIAYQMLCRQIEDLKKRPEQAEKFKEMKSTFRQANHDMQVATRCYNKGLNDISTVIQRIPREYECAESEACDKLQDLFTALGKVLEDYIREKEAACEQCMSLILDNEQIIDLDMSNFLAQKNIPEEPYTPQCYLGFEPTRLPFNVFEFVNPHDFFAEYLEWWGAITIEDATTMTGTKIPANTIVTVKKRMSDGEGLLVMNEDTGEDNVVIAARSVREIPSMKRCIFMLKEEHFDEQWNWRGKRGDYVLGIANKGTEYVCQDAYFMTIEIPVHKLACQT